MKLIVENAFYDSIKTKPKQVLGTHHTIPPPPWLDEEETGSLVKDIWVRLSPNRSL